VNGGIDERLTSLERFVVENDELQRLEEAIGRFNIFDSLGIARVEIRHSNFLAWLLDPAESHGQGALFLKAFLMDLFRQSPSGQRPFSPVELDGIELRGIEIRREWRHIDILIACKEPAFVLAIENKVDSGENNPLQKYADDVASAFPDRPTMFVFLTRSGAEASDDTWVPYTYGDVHRVLTRTRNAYEKSIGDDVLTFLDHYLRLIGSRFMDDSMIDDLCRRIYRNHRQALDLIWDRIGEGGLVLDIEDMLLKEPERWKVVNRTSRRVDFVPARWFAWLPPICALPKADPKSWLTLVVSLGSDKCRLRLLVRPCVDLEVRRRIVKRLIQDSNEFGCSISGKATDKWTTVYSTTVDQWDEAEEPDRTQLLQKISKKLEAVEQKTSGIADALRPLFVGQSTQ
jgi:hypothetical protein